MVENTKVIASKFNPIDCARLFVDGLKDDQRIKFKRMIENNIKCGEGIAKAYNIPYETFISQVKSII